MAPVTRGRLLLDFLKGGRTYRYGPDRSQRADLHLPAVTDAHSPPPVMILIHGGSWSARYGRIVMRGLIADLCRRGWAAWNIEYRRVGNGGGWPTTFEDVAAAIDRLAELGAPLDLERVSLLGHSAGGHLALWAAARDKLPADAPGFVEEGPPLRPRRVIAQAGVCDLAGAYRLWRGGAARALMGGGPEEVPERYDLGDPMRLLPPSVPVLLVHGTVDETVSVELSRSYPGAARASGGDVELVEIDGIAGRHRAHLDPRGVAWGAVTRRLDARPPAPPARIGPGVS
jgi:acetyl esterase/lipase